MLTLILNIKYLINKDCKFMHLHIKCSKYYRKLIQKWMNQDMNFYLAINAYLSFLVNCT